MTVVRHPVSRRMFCVQPPRRCFCPVAPDCPGDSGRCRSSTSHGLLNSGFGRCSSIVCIEQGIRNPTKGKDPTRAEVQAWDERFGTSPAPRLRLLFKLSLRPGVALALGCFEMCKIPVFTSTSSGNLPNISKPTDGVRHGGNCSRVCLCFEMCCRTFAEGLEPNSQCQGTA